MEEYQVEFSEEAIADLDSSFEWGCEKWGAVEAATWYIDTRDSINDLLGSIPLGHPFAPENDQFEVEARQLILGRYCVIFNVTGSVVTILHIRGPYSGS
jgi:plasmid stabilization system protein ParE